MKRLAITIALFLSLPAGAAPIGPSGSDPAGGGPAAGEVEGYVSAGIPVVCAGVDRGFGRTILGLEASILVLGVLRPELHARWPFHPGEFTLTPRVAVAFSIPLRGEFSDGPTIHTLELAPGLVFARAIGQFTPFLDVGMLGLSSLFLKTQTRFFATTTAGLRWAVTEQVALGAHVGWLYTERRAAPAVGLTVSVNFSR